MPVFFQQQINDTTRLGVWKIEETEVFFKGNVPQHRDVTHPHKRLQHLAGRFLLQFLFPDFPYTLIKIADTKKPFLEDEQYHFSISHCADYAAAIVSRTNRVGIDIEIPSLKIDKIKQKFLTSVEMTAFGIEKMHTEGGLADRNITALTSLWSAKEAVFKWYGDGEVDFKKHIQLSASTNQPEKLHCYFSKNETILEIQCQQFDGIVLSWVVS